MTQIQRVYGGGRFGIILGQGQEAWVIFGQLSNRFLEHFLLLLRSLGFLESLLELPFRCLFLL